MGLGLIPETLIILFFAVLIIYWFQKIRIPSLVGLLLTGMLIGPTGLGLIRGPAMIETLADIGVALLLFTIGLEFSPAELARNRKYFFIGGTLQVTLTTLVSAAIFIGLGAAPERALFYGFLVSLSSTAVVLKIHRDLALTHSLPGRISLGMLLFQDLAIVPVIMVLPFIGRPAGWPPPGLIGQFLVNTALIAAAVVALAVLLPRILYRLVKSRVRELFIMTSLLICFGMAFLTSRAGFSLALGAFIAGMVMARSEYHLQVSADVVSFKELFSSLFFISIGLLADLRFAGRHLPLILMAAVVILILKLAVTFLAVRLMGFTSGIAAAVGFALCQVGEFSFLMARLGKTYRLLNDDLFNFFVASSIVTLITAPFLIINAEPLLQRLGWLKKTRRRPASAVTAAAVKLKNHVVVAGYGLNGQNLVRVLKKTAIPFVIIELNPDSVRKCREQNLPVIFGDVSSREILTAAALSAARVFVLATSDPRHVQRAVRIGRELNSHLTIIVRTRYVSEIDPLFRAGANQVVPEEFETSIEIFARTLAQYHIPRNIIDAQIQIIRSEGYRMLRGRPHDFLKMEKISRYLRMGTADTFLVDTASPAAGRSLRELDLRQQTGATAIAIVRNEKSFTSPDGDFIIEAGDILVLVANHRDMDRAFVFLSRAEDDQSGKPDPDGRRSGG